MVVPKLPESVRALVTFGVISLALTALLTSFPELAAHPFVLFCVFMVVPTAVELAIKSLWRLRYKAEAKAKAGSSINKE